MPRIVFSEEDQFTKWVEAFGEPIRYIVYSTDDLELILKPIRNPRDYDYGYIHCKDGQQYSSLVKWLEASHLNIYRCKRYEWRIDQAVGVRIPEAE